MNKNDKAQQLLRNLSPDQRGVAQTLASLKAENTMVKRQNEALKEGYDNMFNILRALCNKQDGKKFTLSESEAMIMDEWRLSIKSNPKSKQVTIKLVTFMEGLDGAEID